MQKYAERVPSKLLNMLGLNTRWGITRIELENVLVEQGLKVLEELQLDPELFRLFSFAPVV